MTRRVDPQNVIDRASADSQSWDGLILETEAAIRQLNESGETGSSAIPQLHKSLEYFREQKANGAPFPLLR